MTGIRDPNHMCGGVAGLESVSLFRCAGKVLGNHGSSLRGIGRGLRPQRMRVSENRKDRTLYTCIDLYPFQNRDIASYLGRVGRPGSSVGHRLQLLLVFLKVSLEPWKRDFEQVSGLNLSLAAEREN